MKSELNPKLNVGDKIMCYHMDGETSVAPGTIGVVTKIGRDPFEDDGLIIEVNWENGSKLALVSSVDAWKKVKDESITEQRKALGGDAAFDFLSKNEELLEHFDWRFLREYLYKIRESGIINMLGATPLLYSGKKHIDRYYGEGQEDNEAFQEVLELAEDSKNKIIQGVVSYMLANNKNLEDMDMVNSLASKFSNKILNLYINLSGYRKNED